MKRWTYIAMLCTLFACKGQKEVSKTGPVGSDMPTWVSQRPVDAFNYVGVGLAMKDRGDHLVVAKKNALNDLASEIKVKVEGNSLLYTLDRKYEFQEEFTSSIQTSTSEELEGYELVDTWENRKEYWSFYRLSKTEHARLKAERKQQALDQAKDLYRRSKVSRMEGDLSTALDMDLRALLAIRDYWAEENKAELNGKEVFLANELYDDLQGLFSNLELNVLPERCELSIDNGFQRELLVKAIGRWDGIDVPLRHLPVVIEYLGIDGIVREQKSTDMDGHVRIHVEHVDPVSARSITVRIATDELVPSDLDRTFTRPLVLSMPQAETQVAIDLLFPRVFLRSNETNLGDKVTNEGVSGTLREELIRTGFRFVNNESQADLLVDLHVSTREGGESSGFYRSFLDMRIVLVDASTQEVVNETNELGMKGMQLTFEKAGFAAYDKARRKVKKDVIPKMISAVM